MNSGLSERELQILLLVAQGLSNRQIAGQLDISDNTVKVHVRNIFAKINVASRTEASLYAVRHGLLIVENQPVAPAPIVEPSPEPVIPGIVVRSVPSRWWWWVTLGVVLVLGAGSWLWWLAQPVGTSVVPAIRQQVALPTRWARLPAVPKPQSDQQLAVFAGQLYVFAGSGSAQWFRFDGVAQTWQPLADLSFVVPTSARVWADGAGLWVVGSDDGRGVWRWDGQQWQRQPLIPATLKAATVVRLDGVLLVLGQMSTHPDVLSAWKLAPQAQSWQPGVDFAQVLPSGQLVALEGVVYLFGDGARVWRLDAATNQWVADRDLPFVWSTGAVTTVLGSILVIDATTPALWVYVPGQGVVSKQIVPTQIALGRQVVTWQAQLIMPNLEGTVLNAYQAIYQTFVPVMP